MDGWKGAEISLRLQIVFGGSRPLKILLRYLLYTILLLVAVGYVVMNHSETEREFICKGETRLTDQPPETAEADEGRLQIKDYRWWVGLWSDSDSYGLFASQKIALAYSALSRSGTGNFSIYFGNDGYDTRKRFMFRQATGELGYQDRYQTFTGTCRPE